VRFQRREYGCGKRWRSGVTASGGQNTDDDEVQRSKELIVTGRKTRSSVYTLYIRDSNKEKRRQKVSIDPGCTSLLDFEDLKVIRTNQD
jgi:hypothetical protein